MIDTQLTVIDQLKPLAVDLICHKLFSLPLFVKYVNIACTSAGLRGRTTKKARFSVSLCLRLPKRTKQGHVLLLHDVT